MNDFQSVFLGNRKMRLRWVAAFLAVLLFAACAAGCGSKPDSPSPAGTASGGNASAETSADVSRTVGEAETDRPSVGEGVNTYALNSSTEGVRILGKRYLPSSTQINCDWTCSGLEMNIRTDGGDIAFTARVSAPFNASCYFRAYVDGQPWLNENGSPYYTVLADMTPVVLKKIPAGEHTVRLIKVTGYTLARAEITRVAFAGTISAAAPAEKSLYLEFIGDSICCGWGVIGNYEGSYADQDGSLAYPYLTATALNADYAVTALSGQGLLKGTPGVYQGYLYASALRGTDSLYQPLRQADVTVVNIGTNDASLQQPAQFHQALEQLLREILRRNPNGRVLLIYNTMNDNYSEEILSLCKEAGGDAAGIYSLRFERAEKEDRPTNHPSAAEQKKEADLLTAFLREKLNETVTAVPFAPPEPEPEPEPEESAISVESVGTGVMLPWDPEKV